MGWGSGTASAGTVVGYTVGSLPPNIINISLTNVNGLGTTSNPVGNWSGAVYAGGIEWMRAGGTDATPFLDYNFMNGNGATSLSKFTSFCIDIVEDVYINYGPYQYDVQTDLTKAPIKVAPTYDTLTTKKVELLQSLWADHVKDAFLLTSDGGQASFQAAIWNIVFDDDDSVGGGHFSMTTGSSLDTDIANRANSWLVEADDKVTHNAGARADLRALTSPLKGSAPGAQNAQDQLVAVPLPAAVQAGGVLIGVLGLGRLYSRMRRRHSNV